MKKKTVILALFSLILFPSCTLHKSSQAKIYHFPTKSFVQIVKVLHIKECKPKTKCKPSKFVSTGSGAIVESHKGGGIILTAGHVCNTALNEHYKSIIKSHEVKIYIVTTKKEHFETELIHHTYAKNSSKDLCLLYAAGVDLPKIRMSPNKPAIGEETYAMAAPAGIFHPPTVPLLRGLYSGDMPDNINVMYTIPSVGGSSGAPVLNNKMELVGMIHAAVREYHHVSISIGHLHLQQFLKKHIKKFKSKERP